MADNDPTRDIEPGSQPTPTETPDRDLPAALNTPEKTDAESKEKLLKYLPIGISLLSLCVSAATFYYQNVSVRHSFRGVLYYVGVTHPISSGTAVNGEFLIVNRGNQYEVLREFRILFAADAECNDNFSSSEFVGPTPLKPSESAVLKLDVPITAALLDRLRQLPSKNLASKHPRRYLCGYFKVLDPNGSPAARFYRFGSFDVKPDNTLAGPFPDPLEQRGFIDLLAPMASSSPRGK